MLDSTPPAANEGLYLDDAAQRKVVGLCVFYVPLLVSWVLAIASTLRSRKIMMQRIHKVVIRRQPLNSDSKEVTSSTDKHESMHEPSSRQVDRPALDAVTAQDSDDLMAARRGRKKMVRYLVIFVAYTDLC